MLVERGAQRAHAAVHHVARRDGVGAGLGLRDRGAGEQLERLVVVDDAVGAQHAAVAVRRVLAQAQVGDDQKVRIGGLDRPRGELDHALVVPRARAFGVLARRQPEQQDGGNAERVRDARLLDRPVDREVVDPRQLRDRRAARAARHHEHRIDEVRDREVGLAHEAAQHAGLAQAAQAGGGEGHRGRGYPGPDAEAEIAASRSPSSVPQAGHSSAPRGDQRLALRAARLRRWRRRLGRAGPSAGR